MINSKAIEYTIRIGLALNCQIASWCWFARKSYFYPDILKNFQISQYDEPLCTDGYLDVDVNGQTVRVGIVLWVVNRGRCSQIKPRADSEFRRWWSGTVSPAARGTRRATTTSAP